MGTLHSRDIEADQRRDAEHQLSCLLEEIRVVKKFERFLLPASEKEMRDAAEQGPVVIISISIHRCDALIIEQSSFRSLQLSRISKKLVDKYSQNPGSIDTLEWLWDAIMAPIIGSLGFTSRSSGDGLPRVWWIPTGKLTKFPIHAAGHHLGRSGETALDTVVSSYASSVKAVIYNRGRMYRHQAKTERLSLVTVAMQDTEGLHTLQDATSEMNAIVAALTEVPTHCPTQQRKSHRVSALQACDIFHLAGHGITNPAEPLQSSLLLEDWKEEPLSVADLLEAGFNTRAPFLACLSACGTSRIQDEKSLDESIHLVNAYQLAGFRHVIGTLWNVNDKLCVEMAQKTYQFMQNKEVKNNDASVSRGLHQATLDLRNQWLDADETLATESSRGAKLDDARKMMRPLWVPYVHFGA